MKKVLAVTAQPIEYNTSSMLRTLRMVNGLVNNGYCVDILTPYPLKNNKYYSEDIYIDDRVTAYRFGSPKSIINNIVTSNDSSIINKILTTLRNIYKRFDLFGSSIELLTYQKQLHHILDNKNYDYIMSFSQPTIAHILANNIYEFLKKNGLNPFYIQQWGDPLALDFTNQSKIPMFIKKIIEKKIITFPDKIIYVSPITLREQKKLFPLAANKMKFIPPPTKAEYFDNVTKTQKKLTFGYFGSYYLIARNLKPLYESIKKNSEVSMIVIGDSDLKLSPTENIIIKDRITDKLLKTYMANCDVLVCLLNSRGSLIPGKIYSYSGINKEILIIVDGESGNDIKQYFSQYNRYTFSNNDICSINEVIDSYLTNGVPSRQPLEAFAEKTIINDIISIL